MENKKKLKTDLNTVKSYKESLLAGMLIGFGVIINSITTPPILGALLFSFGLLTIIQLQIPLYTGRVGFLINKTRQPYFTIFFANCLGILLITSIYSICKPDFQAILYGAAALKFSKTYLAMLCYGSLCGMLIHLAVKCKVPIITIGAIIIFIMIGSEHCIADVPYLYAFFTWPNLIKWLLVVVGNSLGAMCTEGLLNE